MQPHCIFTLWHWTVPLSPPAFHYKYCFSSNWDYRASQSMQPRNRTRSASWAMVCKEIFPRSITEQDQFTKKKKQAKHSAITDKQKWLFRQEHNVTPQQNSRCAEHLCHWQGHICFWMHSTVSFTTHTLHSGIANSQVLKYAEILVLLCTVPHLQR